MPSTASCSSHPAGRSFPQQTLTPMTPDLDLSGSTVGHFPSNLSVQHGDQRQQIIQHLTLLLHAHKCLQRERQLAATAAAAAAACNGDNHGAMAPQPCTVPHCATMRAVLQHMTKCSDFKNCTCKSRSLHQRTITSAPRSFQSITVFNLGISFFTGRIVRRPRVLSAAPCEKLPCFAPRIHPTKTGNSSCTGINAVIW